MALSGGTREAPIRQWYNNHCPHASPTTHGRHAVRGCHANRQPRGHHDARLAGASRSQLVAAEDTRRTAKLLSHYGIPTPTLSFHAHNSRARLPQLLDRLERGESVALVTDAGTPGISDPGVELVAACRRAGHRRRSHPGRERRAARGGRVWFSIEFRYDFWGFRHIKAKDRTAWFAALAATQITRSSSSSRPTGSRQTLTELRQYVWVNDRFAWRER